MESCAIALGPHGIRCNSILPGTIATSINVDDLADPVKEAAMSARTCVGRLGVRESRSPLSLLHFSIALTVHILIHLLLTADDIAGAAVFFASVRPSLPLSRDASLSPLRSLTHIPPRLVPAGPLPLLHWLQSSC